jgi:hypothetical protein
MNKLSSFEAKKFFLVLGFFTLYWICNSTSCTFISEEELLKDIPCDTIDVLYSDLTYIFTGICSTCHNETFTYKPGIILDSYISVRSSINTGLVLPAINHSDGVPPMPSGMTKLSECDIDKIESWINAGMPENK